MRLINTIKDFGTNIKQKVCGMASTKLTEVK